MTNHRYYESKRISILFSLVCIQFTESRIVIPIDGGSGDDTRISNDQQVSYTGFVHHRRKQSQADSTRKASKQIAAQTKS